MCDDFVWDPTLEDLRMRKIGTGSFSSRLGATSYTIIFAQALSSRFPFPCYLGITKMQIVPPTLFSFSLRVYIFNYSPHADSNYFIKIQADISPFSGRKRKHDELFTDAPKEDPRFVSANTIEAPCRASGIRGIYNMGATCYMNVILQCFVHNPLLRNFYLGDGHQSGECTYKNCMSCAMDDMFQDFYAQDNTTGYSASHILASFWLSKRKAYEELASNKEQDAHEFFQFLTEELHEINGGGRAVELSDSPNAKRSKTDAGCKCIVHDTFYGKLQSTITCQKCGDINTSVESFLDISLGLDVIAKKRNLKATTLSLQRCLDEEYIRAERCEYTCHSCGTSEAKKQLSIKSLPNVLCIQLKVCFPIVIRKYGSS